MTSAFEKYHAQRGATPHCLCGSFSQAQHAGEHHFSRPWWHYRATEPPKRPNCSLASSVLLPKIGFDPLTHGPFIQHKRHMRYSQSWLLATAKPGLLSGRRRGYPRRPPTPPDIRSRITAVGDSDGIQAEARTVATMEMRPIRSKAELGYAAFMCEDPAFRHGPRPL